jgi:ATP-dependent DNA helicase 2 subunit 2
MFVHVRELVKTSLADINYSRACEILRVVRDEFREYEWPEIYNDLLRELKKDIVAKKLDGDRTDMWWTIRKFSLGLLTKEEAGQSTAAVEEDEAKEVSLCLDTATLIWY